MKTEEFLKLDNNMMDDEITVVVCCKVIVSVEVLNKFETTLLE